MNYTIFSHKEILRQNKELVELHKRCVKTYLVQRSLKHSKIKKFFIVYDHYVNDYNIRNFFFRPVEIFVQALIYGQLDQISDYIELDSYDKKHKKRRNRKS